MSSRILPDDLCRVSVVWPVMLETWFTPDWGLWGVFLSSFLGATLLPGGSEAVLFGVLKAYPDVLWAALGLATLGNTLGGMTSFYMGRLVKQPEALNRYRAAIAQVEKYGAAALLLAWAPIIGDLLCFAGGWLRINPWWSMAAMALGKFARYWAVTLIT